MFVRVKTTPNSPRKSIQIVEGVRINGKIKQKIVRHIGIAMDEREEQKLKDLANETIAVILTERINSSRQKSLFSDSLEDIKVCLNRKAGRPRRKALEDILAPSDVRLSDVEEKCRIVEGIHDVGGRVFDELYGMLFKKKKLQEMIKDIVLARLESPASKNRTQQNLAKYFGKQHDLDSIYRMMDSLLEKIDEIKRLTFLKTQALFPEKVDLLLFDVTTLYFESVNTDELRNFGYSKDHRFNTTQVVLALATNQDGLPIGYELFEGNKAEVSTLVACIQSWNQLFYINSVCFVGDRAMFSGPNLQLLEESGYHYIIAAKLKKLPEKLQEKLFEEQHYRPKQIGNSLAWMAEFAYSPCSYALLVMDEVPAQKELSIVMDHFFHAYAFIQSHFYYLNKSEKICVEIPLVDEKYHRLLKLLKIKKSNLGLIGGIKILNQKLKNQHVMEIQEITGHHPSSRLIVSYKSSRAAKDERDRQRTINKIKKIIGNKGNPNDLITNTGVKQSITSDEKAFICLDENKIAHSAQWDGLHGIITNIQNDAPESLILRYSKLWLIEESFRINKHTLQMRPIFHWKPERIHAHIAICYMTFSVLRQLQYRVNLTQKISIDTILEELCHVQASIYVHKKTHDRYRVPGYFSNNARKIYKTFNLERSLDAIIYQP